MNKWEKVVFVELPPAMFQTYANGKVIEFIANAASEYSALPGFFAKVSCAIFDKILLVAYAGWSFDHSEILERAIMQVSLDKLTKRFVGGNRINNPRANPSWGEKSFNLDADLSDEVKEIATAEFKRRFAAYQKGETP